jgi:hypothetical protein
MTENVEKAWEQYLSSHAIWPPAHQAFRAGWEAAMQEKDVGNIALTKAINLLTEQHAAEDAQQNPLAAALYAFSPTEPMAVHRDRILATVRQGLQREYAVAFEQGWHCLWIEFCKFVEAHDK